MLIKICVSGGELLFYTYCDNTVARNMLQFVFHWCRQMKSEGTKLKLCGRTEHPRLTVCSTVFKVVWGLELLHCKRNDFFSGLTLEVHHSLQLTQCCNGAARVNGLSSFQEIQKDHIFPIPKDITVPTECWVLNILFLEEFTYHHSMGCCSDSSS